MAEGHIVRVGATFTMNYEGLVQGKKSAAVSIMPKGADFRTASFLGMQRGALAPAIHGLFVLLPVDINAWHLGHYLITPHGGHGIKALRPIL